MTIRADSYKTPRVPLPMSRFTPMQSRAYAPAARPRRLVAALLMGFGALLALGVFLVDTFTPLQSAVAVVYVVVVLLVAASGSRRAIVGAAAGCMVLTAVAYFRGHGWLALDAAMMRCAVSLGAIAITAVLALRNRERLITIAGQASLIELTHDSIFVRDMDDIIVLWNGGAEQLYGWTAHEALGVVRTTYSARPSPATARRPMPNCRAPAAGKARSSRGAPPRWPHRDRRGALRPAA